MPLLLITGASRGLGLEFARQYAADGWDVLACCRDPDKAETLQAASKKLQSLHTEKLDVDDNGSIAALTAKLKKTDIDLLINNAGIYSGKGGGVDTRDNSQSFGTLDSTNWAKVLYTNTIAPFMIAQAFAPNLARAQGKIVNITSKMGSLSEMGNGYVAYRTSKAALNAAMLATVEDLKIQGITLVNLHPGWVQTDMGGKSAPLMPEKSITGMRRVIANLTLRNTGTFLGYDGKPIAW